MKYTGPYIKRVNNEAISYRDACRFLENKITQNLKPDFYTWAFCTYGGYVRIVPEEGCFVTKLVSIGMDIDVAITLRNIGFDTPFLTYGDIAKGKLWSIPHAAVLKFQEEHRVEILEWLKTKEHSRFISNSYFSFVADDHGKGAV